MLISKAYMERHASATARRVWPEANAVCASERLSLDDYVKSIGDDRLVFDMLVGDLHRIVEYPAFGFAVPLEVPPAVMAAYDERPTARGFDSRVLKGWSAISELVCAVHQLNFFPSCRSWPS